MAKALLQLLSVVGLAAATPAAAIPRLDLSGYPVPEAGLQRWVIQPSGLLPKSTDLLISANPHDWRVQLIVGQEVMVDCNNTWLSGPGLTLTRVPDNASWPIVVDHPEGVTLRWRVWKAETKQMEGLPLLADQTS